MSQQPGLLEALLRAVDALNSLGARYALVGAVAVGARSEPRFTRDVDLAVAVSTDDEAELLLGRLIRDGYELRELFQHEVSQEIVTARLVHASAPDILTDILFQTCGIESEIVAGAELVDVFPGVPINVARTGHLIAMKVLSRSDDRPLDEGDLAHLFRVATSEDLRIASEAVGLIQQRGRDPQRDVSSEFGELRSRYRPDEDRDRD